MIIYRLLQAFDTVLTFVFSLIPTIETPAWLITHLPEIFRMIFSFNYYLPIVEAFGVVVWLIIGTMSYKVAKILLNKAGLDITKS